VLVVSLFIASTLGKIYLVETGVKGGYERGNRGSYRVTNFPNRTPKRARPLEPVLEHGADYTDDSYDDNFKNELEELELEAAEEYGSDYSDTAAGQDNTAELAEQGRQLAMKYGVDIKPEDIEILTYQYKGDGSGKDDMDLATLASLAKRMMKPALRLRKENPTEYESVRDQVKDKFRLNIDGLTDFASKNDLEIAISDDMIRGRSGGDYNAEQGGNHSINLEDFAHEMAIDFNVTLTEQDRELFGVYDPQEGVNSLLGHLDEVLDFGQRLLPHARQLAEEDPERFVEIAEELKAHFNIDVNLIISLLGLLGLHGW